MDTLLDMRTAVQSDLTVGAESSLYTPTIIDFAINRAYRKAGGLFRWPALNDAKKASTEASQEYYDAPQTWQPHSLWRLEVDNNQYGEDPDGSPMAYPDYLIWRADDDNANSTEKKWAVQWLRYFIYPVPTALGSNNISIWGQKNVETLSADESTTIFSYNSPEGNEAIALEAVKILKAKGGEPKVGEFYSIEAKQILATIWNKIVKAQSVQEKVQPMFEVQDMFSTKKTVAQNTGNFD